MSKETKKTIYDETNQENKNNSQQFQGYIEGEKQSNVSTDDIASFLEENNNFKETQINSEVKPNGLGIAGGILSIIGASTFIFFGILFIITIILAPIGIILIIGGIFNIKFSLKFMKNFEYKIKSGILSIFFGGLLSAIFILVSQPDKK